MAKATNENLHGYISAAASHDSGVRISSCEQGRKTFAPSRQAFRQFFTISNFKKCRKLRTQNLGLTFIQFAIWDHWIKALLFSPKGSSHVYEKQWYQYVKKKLALKNIRFTCRLWHSCTKLRETPSDYRVCSKHSRDDEKLRNWKSLAKRCNTLSTDRQKIHFYSTNSDHRLAQHLIKLTMRRHAHIREKPTIYHLSDHNTKATSFLFSSRRRKRTVWLSAHKTTLEKRKIQQNLVFLFVFCMHPNRLIFTFIKQKNEQFRIGRYIQ